MLHLNAKQVSQIERIINLLDEGFYHSVKDTVLHQHTDGNVEFLISLGNTLERAKNNAKVETTVIVYSSMMEEGQTRHFYASLEEALEAVEAWHKELFLIDGQTVRVSEEYPQLRLVE
jgi:monomeric isocitrate dehydrogenase